MVIVTLLLVVVSLYTTVQTSNHFEKTSIKREEEFNLQQINLLSWELEHLIQNYVDKVQFYTLYMLQQTDSPQWQHVFQERTKSDYDLVAVKVLDIGSANSKVPMAQIVKTEILKEHELDSNYFDHIEEELSLPLHEVFDGKIKLKNASRSDGMPLLWIGIPIAKNEHNQVNSIASAFIKLDKIQQQFKSEPHHLFYVIDDVGMIISHPDQSLTVKRQKLSSSDQIKSII